MSALCLPNFRTNPAGGEAEYPARKYSVIFRIIGEGYGDGAPRQNNPSRSTNPAHYDPNDKADENSPVFAHSRILGVSYRGHNRLTV